MKYKVIFEVLNLDTNTVINSKSQIVIFANHLADVATIKAATSSAMSIVAKEISEKICESEKNET